MPATYEPIATTTFGGSTATVTFSSISSAYTDLRIVFAGAVPAGDNALYVRLNGSSAANYSSTNLIGTGTSAVSNNDGPNESLFNTGTVTSSQSLITIDVFSYAGSTYKTILTTNAADKNGSGLVERRVGIWKVTTAISSITLYSSGSANFVSGSTITVYGIKAA